MDAAFRLLGTREGQAAVGVAVGFLTLMAYTWRDQILRWHLGLKPFQAIGKKFLDKSRRVQPPDALLCQLAASARSSKGIDAFSLYWPHSASGSV